MPNERFGRPVLPTWNGASDATSLGMPPRATIHADEDLSASREAPHASGSERDRFAPADLAARELSAQDLPARDLPARDLPREVGR